MAWAFSPDGKTFYVDNTEPKAQLYKYDVGPDGKLSNKKLMSRAGNGRQGRRRARRA